MKKFLNEFRDFALRGNIMDMAVGIIIGGAFAGLVTSLTDNFINPIINFVTGAAKYSLADVSGFANAFGGAVIQFIILAFIVFCLMKAINRACKATAKQNADQENEEPTVKTCPFCQSEINIKATRCPNCTSELVD